jgi:hypothetical protein
MQYKLTDHFEGLTLKDVIPIAGIVEGDGVDDAKAKSDAAPFPEKFNSIRHDLKFLILEAERQWSKEFPEQVAAEKSFGLYQQLMDARVEFARVVVALDYAERYDLGIHYDGMDTTIEAYEGVYMRAYFAYEEDLMKAEPPDDPEEVDPLGDDQREQAQAEAEEETALGDDH